VVGTLIRKEILETVVDLRFGIDDGHNIGLAFVAMVTWIVFMGVKHDGR